MVVVTGVAAQRERPAVVAAAPHPGRVAGLTPERAEPAAYKTGAIAQRVDKARAFETAANAKSLAASPFFGKSCSPFSSCPFKLCPPGVPKTVFYYYLGYYNIQYSNGQQTPDGGKAFFRRRWYGCPSCFRCYVQKKLTVIVPQFCWFPPTGRFAVPTVSAQTGGGARSGPGRATSGTRAGHGRVDGRGGSELGGEGALQTGGCAPEPGRGGGAGRGARGGGGGQEGEAPRMLPPCSLPTPHSLPTDTPPLC